MARRCTTQQRQGTTEQGEQRERGIGVAAPRGAQQGQSATKQGAAPARQRTARAKHRYATLSTGEVSRRDARQQRRCEALHRFGKAKPVPAWHGRGTATRGTGKARQGTVRQGQGMACQGTARGKEIRGNARPGRGAARLSNRQGKAQQYRAAGEAKRCAANRQSVVARGVAQGREKQSNRRGVAKLGLATIRNGKARRCGERHGSGNEWQCNSTPWNSAARHGNGQGDAPRRNGKARRSQGNAGLGNGKAG